MSTVIKLSDIERVEKDNSSQTGFQSKALESSGTPVQQKKVINLFGRLLGQHLTRQVQPHLPALRAEAYRVASDSTHGDALFNKTLRAIVRFLPGAQFSNVYALRKWLFRLLTAIHEGRGIDDQIRNA